VICSAEANLVSGVSGIIAMSTGTASNGNSGAIYIGTGEGLLRPRRPPSITVGSATAAQAGR
jgi:hypothetical protein